MPVSAEQWRAAAGSLNAGRGFRSRPSIKRPSLCDLPSPPPSSWKGYIAAFIMLCVPLLYKVYVVGMTVMVYLCSGRTPHRVTNCPYPTGVGLSADVSNIRASVGHYGGMFLLVLNAVLYVTITTAVWLAHIRNKGQWKLTQQLHHLDLFWLNSGPECEVIFDTTTCGIYATLEMCCLEGTADLYCDHYTRKRKKNQANGAKFVGVISAILQLSTIVVALLLLLAGDVERNPGPVTDSELGMANHFKVSQYLEIMEDHQIKLLGGALGLDYTKLSRMNTLPCDMVAAWLRREDSVLATSGHPSWSGLVKALREVGQTGIAEKINREKVTSIEAGTMRKRPRPSEEPVKSKPSGQGPTLDGGVTNKSAVDKFHSCTPSTKKPKYSFPFLDLSGQSDAEAQKRQMQLCNDFDEMTTKFQELKDKITNSITKRNVLISKVLGCISEPSKTSEPVYTDLHQGRSKLRHQFPELLKATSMDEVMSVISQYSSFFNYRLIKQIINSLGSKEDKAKLAEYEQDFQKYAERTVYECPPEIGMASSEDRLSFLVKVHHKGFEECSLSHLMQFLNEMSKVLELPIGMLLLESVVPGCLELTLQLPLVVHQTIFPLSTQQEEALAALGVTKISAGDYQYPSCRDGGDSDHKPDDRPDDGSSDSGRGTLTTVLSDLSAPKLKQDMIDEDVSNPYEMQFDHKVTQSNEKPSSLMKNEGVTPLHVAAYHGRLDHVKTLLLMTQQFSPLQRDQRGNTALHYAVRGHHIHVLKYFVEDQGCNPTPSGAFSESPLHVAARCRDLNIVRYLVSEQFLDPMCQEGDCEGTPLHSACIGGNIEVVRFLVNEFNKYLDINEIAVDRTRNGFTSLHYAALFGHIEVVKYLVSELNCNPNIKNPCMYDQTPLHGAAHRGQVETMKHLIEDCKCDIFQEDSNKATALSYAAENGCLNAVKFFTLDKGCDPSPRDKFDNTPLHFACHEGHTDIVKHLISEIKCDPNIRGNGGATPLHAAAMNGNVEIIAYLMNDKQCDPLQQDDNKNTPLYYAATNGHKHAVKLLTLDKSYRPTPTDSLGNTPLHNACHSGHTEIVKYLISEMKCDPNIRGNNGTTPLHAAATKGYIDIMAYLIDDQKCDPSQQDDDKRTSLHFAGINGQLHVVKFLTQIKRCNPMHQDATGSTPLHIVAGFGHLNVVKFFVENLNCPPDVPAGRYNITPMMFAATGGHQEVVKYLKTAILVKSGIEFYKKYLHVTLNN